jgi:hypothetical protein
MTAVPAWLLEQEQDEDAFVAELQGQLDQPMGDADIDAFASVLLGQLGDVEKDLARDAEAETKIHLHTTLRYQVIRAPKEKRAANLRNALTALALRADFGKKKSRQVGNGVYGKRQVPMSVKVEKEQEVTFISWAKLNLIGAVKARLELSFHDFQMTVDAVPDELRETLKAAMKPSILLTPIKDHVKATGEEPPGVTVIPAHDEAHFEVAESAS